MARNSKRELRKARSMLEENIYRMKDPGAEELSWESHLLYPKNLDKAAKLIELLQAAKNGDMPVEMDKVVFCEGGLEHKVCPFCHTDLCSSDNEDGWNPTKAYAIHFGGHRDYNSYGNYNVCTKCYETVIPDELKIENMPEFAPEEDLEVRESAKSIREMKQRKPSVVITKEDVEAVMSKLGLKFESFASDGYITWNILQDGMDCLSVSLESNPYNKNTMITMEDNKDCWDSFTTEEFEADIKEALHLSDVQDYSESRISRNKFAIREQITKKAKARLNLLNDIVNYAYEYGEDDVKSIFKQAFKKVTGDDLSDALIDDEENK